MSIRRPSTVPNLGRSQSAGNEPNTQFIERVVQEMKEPQEIAVDSKNNRLFDEKGKYIFRPANPKRVRKVSDEELLSFPHEVFTILWNQRTASGGTLPMVRQARICTQFLNWAYDLAEQLDKMNSGVVDRMEETEWYSWLCKEFKKDINIVFRRSNLFQLANAFLEDQDEGTVETPKVARELYAAEAPAAPPQVRHAPRDIQGTKATIQDKQEPNDESPFNEKVDEDAWQDVFENMITYISEASDENTLERDVSELANHLLLGKDSGVITPRQYAEYMHDLHQRAALAKQGWGNKLDSIATKLMHLEKAFHAGAIEGTEYQAQKTDLSAQASLQDAKAEYERKDLTTDAYKRRVKAICEFYGIVQPAEEAQEAHV